MAGILEAAFGLLIKAASGPAIDAAKRSELMVGALRRIGLDPAVPPEDFPSLYAHSLIDSFYGRPEPLLLLFRDEYVRQAYQRYYEDGGPERLHREVENAIDRNRETNEFGPLPYDVIAEVHAFSAAFDKRVDWSRSPREARLEGKVDEMLRLIVETQAKEEERRQQVEPARAELTPAQRLASDSGAWFQAVGYRIERKVFDDGDGFAWVVLVPARRNRFDRVLVLGVGGELQGSHVTRAADLMQREGAVEAWAIAPRRVSKAARTTAADVVVCYTFDELIDQDADFEPYITWLEEQIRDLRIEERYVPLSCRKDEYDPSFARKVGESVYEWREGGLDAYVDRWLEDPAKEHLSILGEFGTGKSWFALEYAWKTAKLWREAKERGAPRPRLPLLVPLRDYAKAVNVQSLFSEFFFRKHEILPGGYSVFQQLNRMGRLLLIFDGFDEMAARVDRQAMVSNFWELATVVQPGAKVLLSCRTEHFPSAREGLDLLSAKIREAAATLVREAPRFEVVDLLPFDDEQVSLVLGKLTDHATVALITGDETLLDLMRRPVMSDLVLAAMPDIEAGAVVDLARVYLYAVQRKMARDIEQERTFTALPEKLYFLCELSWEMISRDVLSINYRDFPDRLRACFGAAVSTEKDLDHWRHDMQAQTMLIRNNEGDYSPAHKSLLEFFVAIKLSAEMGLLDGDFLAPFAPARGAPEARWDEHFLDRTPAGRLRPLSRFVPAPIRDLAASFQSVDMLGPVGQFLSTIVRECPQRSERIATLLRATSGLPPAELGPAGGRMAELLAGDPRGLEGADLRGASLAGLGERGAFHDRRVVNLAGTDLRGADFRGASLSRVLLRSARLGSIEADASILAGIPSVWVVGLHGDEVVVQRGRRALRCDADGSSQAIELPAEFAVPENGRLGLVHDVLVGRAVGESFAATTLVGPPTTRIFPRSIGAMVWNGRPMLFVSPGPDHQHFDIVDPVTLADVRSVPVEGYAGNHLGFWFHNDDVGVAQLRGSRVYRFDVERGVLSDVGIPEVDRIDGRITRGTYGSGFLWQAGEGLIEYWAIGGELVWSSGEIGYDLTDIAYDPISGLVAIGTSTSVQVRIAESDSLVWSRDVVLAAQEVCISPGGGRVAYSSHSGEVTVRDGSDGGLVWERSFSEKLGGATFARGSMLPEGVAAGMLLAGARYEE
jgi:hypothetical protein